MARRSTLGLHLRWRDAERGGSHDARLQSSDG
jgi:hypothetical protein